MRKFTKKRLDKLLTQIKADTKVRWYKEALAKSLEAIDLLVAELKSLEQNNS